MHNAHILNAFAKMLPLVSKAVISLVWSKDRYLTKEEFLGEIEGLEELKQYESTLGQASEFTKDDLIRRLDEALLGAKLSPSVLFREADKDHDGTVHVKELYVILVQLGIKLDEETL